MIVYAQTQSLTADGGADGTLFVRDSTGLAPGIFGTLYDSDTGPISVKVETIDYGLNKLRVSRDNQFPNLIAYKRVSGAQINFATQSAPAAYVPLPASLVAGSLKEVQFNDGNVFGASSAFTFDKATNRLAVGSLVIDGAGSIDNGTSKLNVGNGSLSFFDGATTNDLLVTSIIEIDATGTPDGTTFLRGDGAWVAVPAPVAGTVPFAPTGNVSETDVQGAIEQLDINQLLTAEPISGHSYSNTYNATGTLGSESWTTTVGALLARKADYTYTGNALATITISVYSPLDGTTVIAQTQTTLSYSNGRVSGYTCVRSV